MNNKILETLNSIEGVLLKNLMPLSDSLNTKSKNYSRTLIDNYLINKLGSDHNEYLKNKGLSLKTTPINKGGLTSVEPLRLCSFNLKNLVNESWETSTLLNSLTGFLILPLIVEAKNLGQPYRRVGTPIIWAPNSVELGLIKSDWELYRSFALKGAVPGKRGVITTQLTYPTEKNTNFIHMKPHSVKGKFELDAFGNEVRKMAFYLNSSKLRSVLLSQL
jgi:DNA mismatch repair endonuclease MutH